MAPKMLIIWAFQSVTDKDFFKGKKGKQDRLQSLL